MTTENPLFLYGSQNFGYDTVESDKDWVEIIIPDWDAILNNKMVSESKTNLDNSITKLRDIRFQSKLWINGHFNELQILFSKEMYNSEKLRWFIDNRQRIVKCDLWTLYNTNKRSVEEQLNKLNPKTLTRAYVFQQLLRSLLTNDFEFKIKVGMARSYRTFAESAPKSDIKKSANAIKHNIESLENDFYAFKDKVDIKTIEEVKSEVKRIILDNLRNQ